MFRWCGTCWDLDFNPWLCTVMHTSYPCCKQIFIFEESNNTITTKFMLQIYAPCSILAHYSFIQFTICTSCSGVWNVLPFSVGISETSRRLITSTTSKISEILEYAPYWFTYRFIHTYIEFMMEIYTSIFIVWNFLITTRWNLGISLTKLPKSLKLYSYYRTG